MGTVYDYLTWRGDLTMRAAPFCEVDSLILSMFAYLDMQDIVPAPGEEGELSVWAASKAFLERYPDPQKEQNGCSYSQGHRQNDARNAFNQALWNA